MPKSYDATVSVNVSMRLKVCGLASLDLEEVREALNNGDFDDIMDEAVESYDEVIEVEAYDETEDEYEGDEEDE